MDRKSFGLIRAKQKNTDGLSAYKLVIKEVFLS